LIKKGISILFCVLCVLLAGSRSALAAPVVIDRTVAFVEDDAILLSDLDRNYQKALLVSPGITRAEVLETLINRTLLLREAKKLFRGITDDEQAIKDYIDLKVRAFIKLPEQEVRDYYDEHRKDFGGLEFEQVKAQIETLLQEREVNMRLADLVKDLRVKAYIKTFLEQDIK
jgi:parvulin-like peptidyl-prolyl isomerase